jgi:serine/threonine protein kinase
MRYVQGGDIGSVLRRQGHLAPALTCSVITQVAAALDAAHGGGMVHRDVKPGNILLHSQPPAPSAPSVDPAAGHVYLSDFGISKHSVVASHLTSSGEFVGHAAPSGCPCCG